MAVLPGRKVLVGNALNSMIIVWRGLGILVVLIVGGALAATEASINSITGNPVYYQAHNWPKMLACGIAAGLVFLIAKLRNQDGAPSKDSLFFIPMWIWSFIILVVGLGWAAAPIPEHLPTDSTQPVRVSAHEPAPPATPRAEPTPSAPSPTQVQPAKDAPEEPRLQGIIYVPGNRGTAQISHQTVAVGDEVLGYTVVSIEQQGVTLRSADGKPRKLQFANGR